MGWQRKVPFGYQIERGELKRSPRESETVKQIFSQYLVGASYRQIAQMLTKGDVPYHQRTSVWNINMVKRILENELYLGNNGYPKVMDMDTFLAVRMVRASKTEGHTTCPSYISPLRSKITCAHCGSIMRRNTNSRMTQWICSSQDCGMRVRIADDCLWEQVSRQLRNLASQPDMLITPVGEPTPLSMEGKRIQNELALSMNRGESPSILRALTLAAAEAVYNTLPDPTPAHDMDILRQRIIESGNGDGIQKELLNQAVGSITLNQHGIIQLHLINGKVLPEEEST